MILNNILIIFTKDCYIFQFISALNDFESVAEFILAQLPT